ncbi:MAG: hypothetical protein RLZZ352_1431 [Pseudomonadota bacterium]|jgi:hypothetical protein
MKLRLNKLMAGLTMAGGVAALVGCGNGGAPDLKVLTPEQPQITAPYKYAFIFEDAFGKAVTDELTVTVVGDAVDGGELVDANNADVKGQTYKITNGVLAVAADFDKTTAKDVFTVVGGNRTLGWNESGIQISKSTSSAGDQVIKITLTNTNAAKVTELNNDTSIGLAMKVESLPTTTTGTVADTPITIASPAKTVTNEAAVAVPVGTATVTIPAGTKAVDSSGAAINLTSGVQVSVTKYSSEDASGLSAFPGGFTPSVVVPSTAPVGTIGTGATADTGAFTSGGFAQFNVTDPATGQALKKFDTPLILKIDLPKTTLDFEGNPVVVGGKFPIWSFDQESGKWVYETDGIIKEKSPVDPDKFEVEFPSTHLSYWNLDFYGQTCDGVLNINRKDANGNSLSTDDRPLSVELKGLSGQGFHMEFTITDSILELARYPRFTPTKVTVTDSNGVVRGSKNRVNLCQDNQFVDVTLPITVKASLQVNVTESCKDGVSGIRPSPTNIKFVPTAGGLTQFGVSSNVGSVARVTLNGIAPTTAGTLSVYNRFTGGYQNSSVTVNAPSTVRNFNFPSLNCTTGGVPIE